MAFGLRGGSALASPRRRRVAALAADLLAAPRASTRRPAPLRMSLAAIRSREPHALCFAPALTSLLRVRASRPIPYADRPGVALACAQRTWRMWSPGPGLRAPPVTVKLGPARTCNRTAWGMACPRRHAGDTAAMLSSPIESLRCRRLLCGYTFVRYMERPRYLADRA